MGFVVLHMEKAHGSDSGTTAHIERFIIPKNADPTRTHLNRRLIEYPDGVKDRSAAVQRRLEEAGLTRKIGSNQVRAIRINVSGTHEDMDNILCLRAFKIGVLKQIMEDLASGYSNDDLLALYTLTGGIPKYVELFCDNQALTIDKMYDFVFSENSLFIDEGRNLLITEFGKNYGTYFSILSEIANGHYTQGEIESALGGTAIGGYLSKLENVYNLITRERPIFAKPGTKKNVRYIIGDNFLNFWFKYIERNRSYIELQNFDDLRQLAKADYPTYSGRVLEKYFKQKLAETGGFKEIGSWWETKSSIGKQRINSYEIDIVALKSSGKKALIAEVKRVPENNYSHTVFMEKVEHLKQKEMSKYDIETQVLGLKDM